ncbi:MAG: dTDP-4-dehydrorhamnose reductase [Aphanocapsa sp. GSE-SYN-MK-11-07L]|jgi:dTDP-4-dehydrorhamnose reductase|nr:dTDP-4-dehydrorhamnose reductase [Aphanocapsa sp. GSE-SYN-MK-11-07L]
MSQIVLLGAEGQVGKELQQALALVGHLTALSRRDLDLSDQDQIQNYLAAAHPTVIVNAAAYTAVDRAEQEPDLADQVNAIAPALLAQAAQSLGAALVHLSTDYVFDGENSSPYLESDSTRPLSVYGQSKLQGEENIRQLCDRHLIIRTAWVYGAYGKGNFVKTMLRLGAERTELRVVADQVGTPTWARDLAQAIADLIPKLDAGLLGTYHYTNSGVASWYDLAIAIFTEAKRLGYPLQVERVVPITTADYPLPAQRPAYSVLNTHKITARLGSPPPHWQQSLNQMLQDLYQLTYAHESPDSLRR